MTSTDDGGRALDAVVGISGVLAAGSAIMAIAHAGVEVPVISAFGPGGSRAVVPAAIAFSVAAALHGGVALGVARRRAWAWPLGVLVAAVTLVGAMVPFRGAGSVVGIALAGAQLGLLLWKRSRRVMLTAP